jgi:F-type H+-transporting ATPase subunit b
MDLNATLLGQMITFALFVWFTMKFVWPPIMQAMQERQSKIAEGLAAAERATHDLALAQRKATEQLHEAKVHAAEILEQANKRADGIIEEAKQQAQVEGLRVLASAQSEAEQAKLAAQEEVRKYVAKLAMTGLERLLQQHLDDAMQSKLLDRFVAEI